MSHAPLRRLGAPFLAAVMIAATLAACSGPAQEPSSDAATSTHSDPTRSPSPSASATGVEKPERPAAMQKKDAEGAAAAAEYFLSLEPFMMSTGITADWISMSHRACDYCRDTLENAHWLHDQDSTYEGGGTSVSVEHVYKRDAATGIFPLDAVIHTSPVKVVDASGNLIEDVAAESTSARIEVATINGNWVIVTVASQPGGRR